ncbi:MmgE/PrpD family protein [Microvirga zambiensis]|uniref:MmgE/PrpD family protein n=1 Tax=Microvirga zambiensis TaxID=1402137 RepID=UPI0019200835|nr:MmgE/PrpD family protein [Microvirga zambiensis]
MTRSTPNPLLAGASGDESVRLAAFAAGLKFEHIDPAARERCVDLFVDWLGSALSGRKQRAISAIETVARAMGPQDGPSEVLTSGGSSTPLFAAMINAAASHISEQDDVHNGSVFHPATVVFPAVLAVAQSIGASGQALITASVAGYEVGIRVGEFLGRSHYKVFHTTGTAGTIASAAAIGNLLGLSSEQMLNAFGSAGTQAAGLWEFLKDAADSKQLHTAKAASDGLLAAYLAKEGFTGARRILEGTQGMAAGMSDDADPTKLVDGLGTRWTISETSFKFHASCRHTHPAADALLKAITDNGLMAKDIRSVTAHVHQGAIDVLGAVRHPVTVHQAKFCMGATLGLIATHGRAGMTEFDGVLKDDAAKRFLDCVEMKMDSEVDSAYPNRWIGKVTVETRDGRVFDARVDEPKGDPGNTLSRDEITTKARALAIYGGIKEQTADEIIARSWSIAASNQVGHLGA